MIKDKIIELENGYSYYILNDITYNQKKYVLATLCNMEKDEIDEENYIILELNVNNNDLYLTHINDDNIANIVTKLLLEKTKKDLN